MKKTSVFIIEKEPATGNLIKYHLLSHQVRQVQVFPNLAECLYHMLKRSVPEFLIVDLSSPDINGFNLLNAIKNSFPAVRVIFLSSVSDESLIKQLIEEGASDFIFRSAYKEEWVGELIKNLEYLVREPLPIV
jgi:DNA-binding NarL/FixJ family response regulator